MSDNKKDLTRIEDLGEYLHELNEDNSSFEPPADLPDVPSEETDFSSNFEEQETTFSSEEPAFESNESSFSSEEGAFASEETTFDSGETSFTTEETSTDFDGSDFGTSVGEETKIEEESEKDLFSESEESTPSSYEEKETSDFSFEDNTSEEAFQPEETPAAALENYSAPVIQETYKAPENFEDLKKFAESSSLAGMGVEGNPSFSVLIKNVRYTEDVNDILSMLKELSLLTDSEEQVKNRLMRGHLLIPRISEYAAIFLAHKLRRFDIDIQVGLSDEIHPPKHQETPETGIVSRHSLYQNQTHHFHFDDPKLELAQIILAATPHLEGHQVIRYLGVASEHKMLEGHIVEDEGSEEIPRHYSELAQKLKAHALKAHANAVIGLNYQLTPLPSEFGMSGNKYRLSCTGNLVWVNKL